MRKFLIAILMVPFTIVVQAQEGNIIPVLTGDYNIVTTRAASDVASTAPTGLEESKIIGKSVTFNDGGIEMLGRSCEHRPMLRSAVAVINPDDPLLVDIHVPPTDSPLSAGDQRIGRTFHYKCDGGQYIHVYQVDERVLVIPWQNSSQYLIVEKPLSEEEITVIQQQLKDHKFLEQDANGTLDEATISALSSWSHYRLGDDDAYKFARPAITENLLDTFAIKPDSSAIR